MFEDDLIVTSTSIPAPGQEKIEAPKFEELIDHAFIGDIHAHDDLLYGTAWQTPFKIRTKKPVQSDVNSKCYVNYETGGWSGAIVCSNDYANVLPNCVGYANGRFNEIYAEMNKTTGSKYPWLNCNACDFIKRAQSYYPELEIAKEPVPGAIMVWTGGWGNYGHVAIVERINYDGSLFTSESAYSETPTEGNKFYTATRYPASEWGMGGTYKFAGFILNPAVPKIAPEVTPDTKRDEKKNQLMCDIPDLRVRTSPSLKDDNNILDLLPKGNYYNYDKVGIADGYEWFRIAENQWCARVDENAPYIYPYDLFPTKYAINLTEYKEGILEADVKDACAYDTVHVNVRPAAGYVCTKMLVNGKEIINNAFKMPRMGNVTITAEFKETTYSISTYKTLHGKINVSKTKATLGEEITVEAIPNEGYKVARIYSEQVVIKDNKFIMPARNVEIFAEFEAIAAPKFSVGEKVQVLRPGNASADGSHISTFYIGEEFLITNIVWGANFTLEKYPYQLSGYNGHIVGYYKEEDIAYPEEKQPDAPQAFQIGETVRINGKGNTKPDGKGYAVYGLSWKKKVLDYVPGALYAYKLGTDRAAQGYYREQDISKI